MKYRGLQSQIWHNNFWSSILLISFPIVFAVLTYLFFFILNFENFQNYEKNSCPEYFAENVDKTCKYDENWKLVNPYLEEVNSSFLEYFPFVWIWVFFWFMIAFFSHSSMIKKAVWAKWISRKENPELYNLLENLCISQWMKMPKIAFIEDSSLNAFASWINENTYTITLSRWIIEKLDIKELETVIAHELWHIKNKDTRLLIISIIFVWVFSFMAEMIFRSSFRSSWNNKKWWQIIIIALILAIVWYVFAILIRFALSRKREFLADAASAEMTKNPLALASALRKISWDPVIEALNRKDLAQAFIENPQVKSKFFSFWGIFSTHPKIEDRIRVLESF